MYIDQYISSFENFADKNALTCLSTNKTFTYHALHRLTTKLGNRFRSDGLTKGDVVMVCLFNVETLIT